MKTLVQQAREHAADCDREAARILERRRYSAFTDEQERFFLGETRADHAARWTTRAAALREAAVRIEAHESRD
jgi:hypothetical protein